MASENDTRSSYTSGDVRLLLVVIVIVASSVAGGLWAGQMTNPTSGVSFPGVLAGLFLGIALASAAWIASTRPQSHR